MAATKEDKKVETTKEAVIRTLIAAAELSVVPVAAKPYIIKSAPVIFH
jgi:hypothetical protein